MLKKKILELEGFNLCPEVSQYSFIVSQIHLEGASNNNNNKLFFVPNDNAS